MQPIQLLELDSVMPAPMCQQGSKQITRCDERIAEKEAERKELQTEWEQRSRRLEEARLAGNAAKQVSQYTQMKVVFRHMRI